MRKLLDALIALAVISLIVGIFWAFGLHLWAVTFGLIGGVVALMEGVSVWRDRQTLSQRFWAFRKIHPVQAWLLIGLLAMAWFLLLVHLTAK